MIEAASLGVGVGWQDAGAVRGMKDLQREVADTARASNSQMNLMEQSSKKSLGGMRDLFAGLAQTAKGALGDLGTTLSGLGGKVGSVLGVMGKLAAGLAAGIGLSLVSLGGAAIKVVKDLIAVGSDAEEMLGKFNVVFGAQTAEVTQQLTAYGAAVNRSKYELQEMASAVQGTFVPLGFARDQAASMSVTLTELATDVASFNKASAPDVVNAFTNALQGNYEAVRQYKVVITDATLNTELLAMGIEKGTKGASEQEKVQARLNLIMKATADAQGYAARTSDSWKNTMTGLRAVIADTQKEIGLKLLPIMAPMQQQFADLAHSVGPEVVRQVSLIAQAFTSMSQVLLPVSSGLSNVNIQFTSLGQSINADFWAQVFGFIGQQIALTITNFREIGFELSSIGQQFQAFGSFLKGDTSWSEYRARMQELQVEYDNAHAAFQRTYDDINSRDWSGAIAAVSQVNQLNAEATDWWERHREAAVPAAEEIATTVADSLGQLWEQVLPKDEEGWAAYLEQMTTAMTDSSSLLTEHSETQLGLIAEYGVRRAELALQEQEAVAALEAAGQEDSAARLSEYFDTMLEGLNDQYQARIDAEAGAQGVLLDLQSGAQGTLLENLGAFMSEAAERYGNYAETIVSLEQERDNVLAFLEAQYQNERARLQVSGDNQSLSLLASAHQAKYGNVVAYYNQRIKTEQTGQRAVFNVAKAYYLQTLMMMRLQLVNQLKTVAGTMDALVRAMVGGYGAITAAAYAAKLAQEGKDLAAISSGIADVQNMMAALEGSGVAAASQASVAFDDWKDTVDDLGGGLDGIGEKLGGIGDPVGGSGGVKEKIIDPIKEAADMAQRLAQMVDKAIGAFDLLSEYGGPTPGWIDGYRKLLEAVEVMVEMFAETTAHIVAAGLIAQKKREQLADSATLISGAIKVISDALKISEMLQDVELDTVDVTAILERLKPQILTMTQAIVSISDTLAALGKNKLRDTSQAAEYIVDTMKPWSEAVKAITALATMPATDPTAAIQGVVEQIVSLIRAMGAVTDAIARADLRRISQSAAYVVDALKPWTSAVAAIKALTDVPAMDISEVADRVLGDILRLVEKLRFAQRQLDPAMMKDLAQSMAPLGELLKPWAEGVKAITALASLPASNVDEAGARLVESMFNLIRQMQSFGRMISREQLEDLARVAATWTDILKPWDTAAKVVKEIAENVEGDIGPAADLLVNQIFGLTRKLASIARNMDQLELEELSKKAALLINVLKPWETAAKTVETIAGGTWERIGPQADRLVGQMFNLIRKLSLHSADVDKAELERLGRLAQPLIDALKPWDAAAKAVEAIAGGTWERIGPRAEKLVGQMFNLIRKLSLHSADVDKAELDRLGRLAQPLIDALKPWDAAAKAVEAIAGGTWERIGPRAEKLVGQMFNLIRKLSLHSANIDKAELDRLGRLAQPLIDALKPWEEAAKAVDAIAGAAVGRIGPAAEMLVGQILGLVRKLGRIVGQIRPEDLAAAAGAAALFVEALKPWEVAAKAVDAIGRTTGEKIGPQAERLVMQMVGLARKLARVAREMPAGQLQEAARVATLFSDSLKPWQEAMTAVQALSRFANSTRIGPQAERLVQQMMGLARKLARAGREVGLADLEFAARIGRLFGDVLEPWNKAITLSNDLRMWRELPDLQERMTRFARIWVDVVADLSKAVNTLSTQGMEAVAAFGRSLTDLMGGLQAALNVVSDFDFEPPDPAMWGNFQGWVQDTFTSFYAWINAYGIPEPGMPAVPSFDEKGLAAVSLFAQALRDLMGGLEAALGIATDFEFQEPDPTMWAHFQSWVQSVFVSFYEWVNATAPPEPPMPGVPLFGGDGLAAVGAFASALNSLMQGLQAALAIAKDFEFQTPDATQWNNFFTWVTGVFQAFYTDIITRYPPEDPTTTFAPVAAWGGALGALMGGLQSALAIAKDFEFQEPPEDQWNAFFDWTTTVFTEFNTAITTEYPTEDPAATFAPVAAWGGALGALMGGLQAALGVASGFQFTAPPETQWDAFFVWTTSVFSSFATAIAEEYPTDDPEATFAPVVAWSNAFGALMGGLQSAINLVSEFNWQAPPANQWDDFMAWSLAVLTSFRDAIIEDYPNANAATWAPVVAWSGALTALMQALQAAVTTADQFVFIDPDELGWDNFFTWVFRVFDEFRLEVLRLLPENPQEAGLFPAVIALSNAIGAIFSGLQSALAFFMDLHGPGEAFWTFLGGAGGNPDTSPFRQRMGYVIGAITGTMAAFDAWVVTNAPTWTGNANTLLTKVTTITGILQDAIELFDFMQNTTLPSTAEIQLFVTAVLQLFSSFAGELTNLTGEGGIGSHVNAIATTVSGFVATTMPPQILNWTQAGSDLVGGFASGMASKIGPATVTGTVRHAIAAIQSALGEFTGWWAGAGGGGSNAGPGWYYWYNAGDALVDAFIEGMESNLGNPEGAVYNAAFAIGQAANAGLEAGAAAGGGGYRPEGPAAGLGKAAAGTFGWSSPSVSSERNINVTIRFENAPANLDRRTLDELKRTLVYEIQRGA